MIRQTGALERGRRIGPADDVNALSQRRGDLGRPLVGSVDQPHLGRARLQQRSGGAPAPAARAENDGLRAARGKGRRLFGQRRHQSGAVGAVSSDRAVSGEQDEIGRAGAPGPTGHRIDRRNRLGLERDRHVEPGHQSAAAGLEQALQPPRRRAQRHVHRIDAGRLDPGVMDQRAERMADRPSEHAGHARAAGKSRHRGSAPASRRKASNPSSGNAEDGEEVALDTREQLRPLALELVGADGGQRRSLIPLQIGLQIGVREVPHGQRGGRHVAPDDVAVTRHGDRGVQLVGPAAQRDQALARHR